MNSRRKFLRNTALSSLAVLPFNTENKLSSWDNSFESFQKQKNFLSEAEYWKAVRMQFPLKQGQAYFNNATLGPLPDYTMSRMIEDMRENAIHAAETDYVSEGPQLLTGYFKYESLRTKIGKLIHADFDEIAITQNATFGMNYVANGLDLKKGDELLNTDQEHGGGYAAWKLLAKRRGCIYKQAKMPVPANDPDEVVQSIFKEVTRHTRVIAIPHIVSVYGVVMPVKEICAEARKRGIFTVVDGAQALGQIEVDVRDIGCDAYYGSLHKWFLAPAGSGILYIKKERMPEIWTTIASYNWENEEDHGFRLMQTGTGNTAILAGIEASFNFYNTIIGPDKWLNRIKFLGDYLRSGLKSISKVTIYSSTHPDMSAGVTTYGVKGIAGSELQKTFWERERLQPRSEGGELIRHSVHIYNNEDEIDRTFKLLRSL